MFWKLFCAGPLTDPAWQCTFKYLVMNLVCFNVCPSHTGLCGDVCGLTVHNSAKVWCIRNISMHGLGGGVLYSHDTHTDDTHTAWKADQITCKHFNSCIGYTKRGRSAQSQVKVFSPCIVVRFQIHVQFYTLTKALTYQHIYSHCNIPEGNDSPTKKGILNWVEDPRHWSPIVTNIWARMPHKLQRTGHVLQAFSLTRSTSDLNILVVSWFRLLYRKHDHNKRNKEMGKYWKLAISHGKHETKGVPMRSRLHPKIHWLTPMMTHPKSAPCPPVVESNYVCMYVCVRMFVCVCAHVCVCRLHRLRATRLIRPHEPREPVAGMRIKVGETLNLHSPNM